MSCMEYNSDCVEKLEEEFNETDLKVQLAYLDKEIYALLEERGSIIRKIKELREDE